MILKTLNLLRITIKKLNNPIGLLCLLPCLAISWIIPFGSIYSIYESFNLKTSEIIQTDIRTTQHAWDTYYSPNTDYIERKGLEGSDESLLSVCDSGRCNIYRGPKYMTEACKRKLSNSEKFHSHS